MLAVVVASLSRKVALVAARVAPPSAFRVSAVPVA
jgi:hypothetical protein